MSSLNDNTLVDEDDVRTIFSTDLSDDALIEFINMAAETMDDVRAKSPDIPLQRQRLIEMNLAAHYATSDDPQALQESVGDASFMYVRDREVTEYLKTAADLDPSGMISVSREPAANIHVTDGR